MDRIEPLSLERQIQRQVEQYLWHKGYDHGSRVVDVQVACEMVITLTKHLTERLEVYEKAAMDQAMLTPPKWIIKKPEGNDGV